MLKLLQIFSLLYSLHLQQSYGANLNGSATGKLNCTEYPGICGRVCNDGTIFGPATFCDPVSGSCICDCRDVVDKSCLKTPFTPCFQDCVNKNPNPDVFLYEGANCPVHGAIIGNQCACECSLREDYVETNDVF